MSTAIAVVLCTCFTFKSDKRSSGALVTRTRDAYGDADGSVELECLSLETGHIKIQVSFVQQAAVCDSVQRFRPGPFLLFSLVAA